MEQQEKQYMEDAQGRLVPMHLVRPVDQLRDELVKKMVAEANALQTKIREFKQNAFVQIADFISLSASEFGVELGGEKGNVTLTSYDGRYKAVRSVQELLRFDERLQVAKELIDQCINRWSTDARPEVRILVQQAFQTDGDGRISTARVLELRRYPIEDQEWKQAMQAIGEAVVVAGSASYVRFYERNGQSGKFEQISLDIAGV